VKQIYFTFLFSFKMVLAYILAMNKNLLKPMLLAVIFLFSNNSFAVFKLLDTVALIGDGPRGAMAIDKSVARVF